MNPIKKFEEERSQRLADYSKDESFKRDSLKWTKDSMERQYVYNFEWMGRPVIQYPQDIMALQEIIWKVKPDLIIETGIAHGGSVVFSASMLELLGGDGEVLAIDIDIRQHNRDAIESHPMASRISMIEGSSIDDSVHAQVLEKAKGKSNIMVILDSNHTHDHVQKELAFFADLVSVDSYLVVLDTFVEDMPKDFFKDRPWNVGDNPKTAVHEFLKSNDDYEVDSELESKLMVTVAPDGYLKRVK